MARGFAGLLLLAVFLVGCDRGFFVEGPSDAPSSIEVRLLQAEGTSAASASRTTGGPGVPGSGAAVSDPEVPIAASGLRTFEQVDRVRVRLAGGGHQFLDEDVAAEGSGGEIRLRFEFEMTESPVEATLELELFAGQARVFRGEGPVTLERGRSVTVELPLVGVAGGIRLPPEPSPLDALGDTVRLRGAVVFATGDTIPGVELTWSSLDPEVVEISTGGLATAIREGSAVVRGAFEDHAETLTVRVEPIVTEVQVSPTASEIDPGETLELTGLTLDRLGNALEGRALDWSSSAPDTAAVDGAGRVTGLRPGPATILAVHGGVEGSAEVVVRLRPPTATTLPPAEVQPTQARLRAEVDPRGTPAELVFRWGTDPDLVDAEVTEPIQIPAGIIPEVIEAPVSGLAQETAYHYRAEVSGEGGEALGEIVSFVTSRPIPPPINLTATWEGPVRLSWAHPDPRATPARVFEVERVWVENGVPTVGWELVDSTSTTGFVDSTAEPGNTWGYRVRACESGACSPYSGAVTVFVPLPAPSTIAGTVRYTGSPVAGMAVGLTGPGTSRTTTTGSGGTYSFGDLEAGSYQVTITPGSVGLPPDHFPQTTRTATVFGGGETVVLDFEGSEPPPEPEGLTVQWRAGEVRVGWAYPFPQLGSVTFEVDRGLVANFAPPTSWSTVGSSSGTQFVDASAAGPNTWAYRTRACDGFGCSAYSAIDSTNVPGRAIYGNVTYDASPPIPVGGMGVQFYRMVGTEWTLVREAYTDDSGYYEVTDFPFGELEPGEYMVFFSWTESAEMIVLGTSDWVRVDHVIPWLP